MCIRDRAKKVDNDYELKSSQFVVDEMNRLLKAREKSFLAVSKKRGSLSTYVIKAGSYKELKEILK